MRLVLEVAAIGHQSMCGFRHPIAEGFHDYTRIAWGLQDFDMDDEGTMGHETCGVFAPRL